MKTTPPQGEGSSVQKAMARVVWETDLIGVRLLLAIGEFSWAVMLFNPGPTFGRPTYTVMASAMSEELWTLVFLLSGVTQVTLILLRDNSSAFCRYFSAWNCVLWLYVPISMILSVSPPPAAIGGDIALAFGAFWVWIRPYVLAAGLEHARKASGV